MVTSCHIGFKVQHSVTLTPLHVAFVWMLKPGFARLNFAAMTVGSMIPDIEPVVSWVFGWSVFCGLDFPCTLAPDRLVLHSIAGALTADVVLTILFVKVISVLKVERIGVRGFIGVRLGSGFYVSAAIGSLSHVFVDWLHHPANPIFWPFLIDGSYYVGGLLLPFMSVLHASIITGVISGAILVTTVRKALNAGGYSFWLVFSNPEKALTVITENLSRS